MCAKKDISNGVRIMIDKEKCIGCGTCVALCDEFFELGPDNKSRLKKGREGEVKDIGCAKDAAEACPAQCIKINLTTKQFNN